MKDIISLQESPLVTIVNFDNLEKEIVATKAKTGLLKGLIEAIKSE